MPTISFVIDKGGEPPMQVGRIILSDYNIDENGFPCLCLNIEGKKGVDECIDSIMSQLENIRKKLKKML